MVWPCCVVGCGDCFGDGWVLLVGSCHLSELRSPDLHREVESTSSVVDHIMPKSLSGTSLSGLPPDIEPLWAEIRRAAAEGSPTLAVMGCRKMLMHLAVEAAKEDGEDDPSLESFWSAAEYLKNNNWFPKRAPDIGHIIREAGNDVNHEVVMSDDSEAEVVILFTEAVLRTMYHYPAQVGELDQPHTE